MAEVIFTNGVVITMDDATPAAQAVAVSGGRVVAVGTTEVVMALQKEDTHVIDLEGGTLLPGFIEPHTHPAASAVLYDWVDLSGFSNDTAAQVIGRLREATVGRPAGEWILGFGYDPILVRDLEGLTANDLDGVSTNHPIFVMLQSMHTCFVNHAAMDVAGVNRDTKDPGNGGVYVRDEQGNLTGMLVEPAAATPFLRCMPRLSEADGRRLLDAQLLRYAARGITTIGITGLIGRFFPNAEGVLKAAVSADNAPVRAALYHAGNLGQGSLPSNGSPGPLPRDDETYRVNGIKFWLDGSPYTGTMLLDDPYVDSPLMQCCLGVQPGTKGHHVMQGDTMARVAQPYHDVGWQVAVHAQGDRAVREVVDFYAQLLQTKSRVDHRHRLEHLALALPEDLQRAKDLGVTPSFHVNHVYYYGDALRDEIIGAERADRLMPVGTAAGMGHRVTLHSDSPMYPPNPLLLVRTAVTRLSRLGSLIAPAEAVPVETALRAVTINAAWQLFREDDLGSITVGKLADFVLLGGNPILHDVIDIHNIPVLQTYKSGTLVYDATVQHAAL